MLKMKHNCYIVRDNPDKPVELGDGCHCNICGRHGYICGEKPYWSFSWDGKPYVDNAGQLCPDPNIRGGQR